MVKDNKTPKMCGSLSDCMNTSVREDGVETKNGTWYCQPCYLRNPHQIDEAIVYFTKPKPKPKPTPRSSEFENSYNPCGEITLSPRGLKPKPKAVTEVPEGWDIVKDGLVLLRFDGVVVSWNQGWGIVETNNPILRCVRSFSTHFKACAAADEHIPMGDLL